MKLINEEDIKVGYYLSYYDENTDDTMEWKFVDPKKVKVDSHCESCEKPINNNEVVLYLDLMMVSWTIHTRCIDDNFDNRDLSDFKVIQIDSKYF